MSMDSLSGRLAFDVQGLQRLQQSARSPQDDQALREASRQFEAMFLHSMLKSMRAAIPQSGLLDSSQQQFYTELLDQQLAQELSGQGLGLAEQLLAQLQQQRDLATQMPDENGLIAGIPQGVARPLYGALPLPEAAVSAQASAPVATPPAPLRREPPPALQPATLASSAPGERVRGADHVRAFVEPLAAPAQAASRRSGVPAELILAQAALETGWGRREIATAAGGNSHNLFGIKAGSQWRGATTDVLTTEFIDGRAVKRVERFRAYPSYQAAFDDYARLIGSNPRYAGVLSADSPAQAARALQQGGYATDPAYADKLVAVMASIGPLSARPQIAQLGDNAAIMNNRL